MEGSCARGWESAFSRPSASGERTLGAVHELQDTAVGVHVPRSPERVYVRNTASREAPWCGRASLEELRSCFFRGCCAVIDANTKQAAF